MVEYVGTADSKFWILFSTKFKKID